MKINTFHSDTVTAYTLKRTESHHQLINDLPTISLEQTHSAEFTEVTYPVHHTILTADAAFTRTPNLHLKVKHADCLPVLLYHPSQLIGVVHAGRKSTEQQILYKLLLHLKKNINITSQLELWFGPAICNKCYQIDQANKLHYDLIQKNTEQVRKLFSENQATIKNSNLCTAHENEQFYSYRKEGKGVPMNWSGIALVTK